MAGYLAIGAYVLSTVWVWVSYGVVPGVGTAIVGFVVLNLVGPKIDALFGSDRQEKTEEGYERKLRLLMSQHSDAGGLPGDLAFLFACVNLPPQKTLLARFERVTKGNRDYLKRIRAVANATPHWQLPIASEAVATLRDDCLSRLEKYSGLGEAHQDPYLQDWVERVVYRYQSWYND